MMLFTACAGHARWFTPAPVAAPISSDTLAAWEAVLRAYRQDPGPFSPQLFIDRQYFSDQPLYWVDGYQPGGHPIPPKWSARLIADSVVDGLCGYYDALGCWMDVRARYITLSAPRSRRSDSLEVTMDVMSQTRSLCGSEEWSTHQASWTTSVMLLRTASGFRIARDSVTRVGDDATCTVDR
jgi:hypothetical protein